MASRDRLDPRESEIRIRNTSPPRATLPWAGTMDSGGPPEGWLWRRRPARLGGVSGVRPELGGQAPARHSPPTLSSAWPRARLRPTREPLGPRRGGPGQEARCDPPAPAHSPAHGLVGQLLHAIELLLHGGGGGGPRGSGRARQGDRQAAPTSLPGPGGGSSGSSSSGGGGGGGGGFPSRPRLRRVTSSGATPLPAGRPS